MNFPITISIPESVANMMDYEADTWKERNMTEADAKRIWDLIATRKEGTNRYTIPNQEVFNDVEAAAYHNNFVAHECGTYNGQVDPDYAQEIRETDDLLARVKRLAS